MHLNLHNAVALTGFAASALHVEAEPAGTIAAHFGVLRLGKHVADVGEHTGVGGRVRTGCAADGCLVDADNLVHVFQALDLLVFAGAALGAVQLHGQGLVEDLVDQAGLAAAGHAGHADHLTQRDIHVHILQIVLGRAHDTQLFAVTLAAGSRHFDSFAAGQIRAGDAAGGFADILHRTLGHNLAAVYARAGTNVHDVVCLAHGVFVVLHHHQCVAQIPQPFQGGDQLVVVPLV